MITALTFFFSGAAIGVSITNIAWQVWGRK